MADTELDVRQLCKPDTKIVGCLINNHDGKAPVLRSSKPLTPAATAAKTSRRVDESLLGDASRRVARMHRTFSKHRERLAAVTIVAHKPMGAE